MMQQYTVIVIVGCVTKFCKNVESKMTIAINGAGFMVLLSTFKYCSVNVTKRTTIIFRVIIH